LTFAETRARRELAALSAGAGMQQVRSWPPGPCIGSVGAGEREETERAGERPGGETEKREELADCVGRSIQGTDPYPCSLRQLIFLPLMLSFLPSKSITHTNERIESFGKRFV
jgi:hypothetical protein